PTTTITFDPGDTSKTFDVTINGDTINEGNEVFTVNLSNPTNATILKEIGVGTIIDDDGTPTISINNKTVTEGNTGTTPATFTVTLSNPSGQTITVDYATADGTTNPATAGLDYNSTSGTLTFAPGETSKTISVYVIGDLIDESDETFTVTLSNASSGATIPGGTTSGTGTITDDDGEPTISINDVSVTEPDEGSIAAVFTVTLSNPSSQTITVEYATADGTATAGSDYTAIATTMLTFAPGETSKTISVAVLGDVITENNETFFVNLSNASSGATISDNQGIGTILDNDGINISISDASATEGNTGTTTMTFTVSLSRASTQTVTVDYKTVDGTATAGSDYVAITTTTLTFDPGDTSKTFD